MTTATARSVQRPADLLLAAAFAAVTQVEVWVFSLGNKHPIGLRVVASGLTLICMKRLATMKITHVTPHAQAKPTTTWAICAASWPASPYSRPLTGPDTPFQPSP